MAVIEVCALGFLEPPAVNEPRLMRVRLKGGGVILRLGSGRVLKGESSGVTAICFRELKCVGDCGGRSKSVYKKFGVVGLIFDYVEVN
jgi:hypothetical protein